MASLRRFKRRADRIVTAVQLRLETDGFRYHKWGGEQRCKPGDWLVDNDGEVYTVDRDTFARTYRLIGPGQFFKFGLVWAERASCDGRIPTKEGHTSYEAGDYLVYNDPRREDGYAIKAATFERLYEPDNESE
jgi:hypothetical protein